MSTVNARARVGQKYSVPYEKIRSPYLQRVMHDVINVLIRARYDAVTFTAEQDSGACRISLTVAGDGSTLGRL